MSRGLKKIRQVFRGAKAPAVSEPFRRQTEQWQRSRRVIRLYYFVLFLVALRLADASRQLVHYRGGDWLWPVSWLEWVPPGPARVYPIVGLFVIGSFAAAVRPELVSARAAAALGLFLLDAYRNSFGKINHSYTLWVVTAIVLVFMPQTSRVVQVRREHKACALQVLWIAQAIILLSYSMAGLGKTIGLSQQIVAGQTHVLAPQALAMHIAATLLERNTSSLWGDWLIRHSIVGWPMMIGALYLECVFFAIAFRPALHRIWGLALISFHLSIYLFTGVSFLPVIPLLVVLFVFSPFAEYRVHPASVLRELPLIGRAARSTGLFRVGGP